MDQLKERDALDPRRGENSPDSEHHSEGLLRNVNICHFAEDI